MKDLHWYLFLWSERKPKVIFTFTKTSEKRKQRHLVFEVGQLLHRQQTPWRGVVPPTSFRRGQALSISAQTVSSFDPCLWASVLFFFFFFPAFLGPHPQHVEVLRLGVKSELQLLACTTATATQDLSHDGDLHHRSQQHQILNSLSESRVQTQILMDTSQVLYCWAMTGAPLLCLDLTRYAFHNKVCPKVIASSLYIISACKSFHRNALLSDSRAKVYILRLLVLVHWGTWPKVITAVLVITARNSVG